MLNKFLLVLITSLFLAACGGGGGGGGGTPSNDSDTSSSADSDTSNDSDSEPDEQDGDSQEYVQQNQYLPLIEGAGWNFSGGVDMTASLEEGDFGEQVTAPVYSFTNDMGDFGTLKQYFTSEADKVSLIEFGGEITFTVESDFGNIDVTINSIEFSEPIVIVGNEVVLSDEKTISADVNIAGVGDRQLNADISVSNADSSSVLDLSNGSFNYPTKRVMVSIRLYGTINVFGFNVPVDETLSETSELIAGLGFVKKDVFVAGSQVAALEAIDLINLPYPVVYSLNQGTPVLQTSSTPTIDQAWMSAVTYSVLNEEDFGSGANDWISIEAAQNEASYDVSLSATANTPDETTAKVVYFGEENASDMIPLNVTLLGE